jgi:hypothetical protein
MTDFRLVVDHDREVNGLHFIIVIVNNTVYMRVIPNEFFYLFTINCSYSFLLCFTILFTIYCYYSFLLSIAILFTIYCYYSFLLCITILHITMHSLKEYRSTPVFFGFSVEFCGNSNSCSICRGENISRRGRCFQRAESFPEGGGDERM